MASSRAAAMNTSTAVPRRSGAGRERLGWSGGLADTDTDNDDGDNIHNDDHGDSWRNGITKKRIGDAGPQNTPINSSSFLTTTRAPTNSIPRQKLSSCGADVHRPRRTGRGQTPLPAPENSKNDLESRGLSMTARSLASPWPPSRGRAARIRAHLISKADVGGLADDLCFPTVDDFERPSSPMASP